MIKPINFTGKAYFSENVKKTIDPVHKKRIEAYASKKPSDVDVFVMGHHVDYFYEINGVNYTAEQCKLVEKDNQLKIEVDTEDGKIAVAPSELKEIRKPSNTYNAYIINGMQKSNIKYMPDKKQFCFSPYKSTIIYSDGREHEDIDF